METSRFASVAFVTALAIASSAGTALATPYKVLHRFNFTDGANPVSGVALAPHGGYYVATHGGGAYNLGALTLINKDGSAQVLHSFSGGSGDGQTATGTPLLWSADKNLYGTTEGGGPCGTGTVYKLLRRTQTYQLLYGFQCGPDGMQPYAGLTDTGQGSLVGSGTSGGTQGEGGTFVVHSDGAVEQACSLSGPSLPYAGVTEVPGVGEFVAARYGLPGQNYNFGAIIRFDDSCNPVAVHTFTGGSDGSQPFGKLLYYNNTLYGTTSGGGVNGLGTVFRISANGGNYAVIHTFQGICCGTDGSFPFGGLTLNTKDNMLYGTTQKGGNSSDNGTIYKIDPNTGAEQVVYSFSGGNDGAQPLGDLYFKNGKLIGTTSEGGGSGCDATGCGTLFQFRT